MKKQIRKQTEPQSGQTSNPVRSWRSLAVFALLLLVTAALAGQERHRMALPNSEVRTITSESGRVEIPFRLVNNHLIVPLSINGSQPLDVVLDTGMPAGGVAVYDGPRLEGMELEINPAIQAQVGGAGGGERLMAQIAMSESLSLPGLQIDGATVIVMPEMPEMSGYHHGIIGSSLFSHYVVEIDYDASVLRLHEPMAYAPPAGASVVPLTFHGNVPYAPVTLRLAGREPFEAKVVVDLGASHPISLNRGFSDQIVLPSKTVSAIIGRGVSGLIRGEVGRIAGVELGGKELEDVVATFPVAEHQNPRGIDSLAGNLGSGILRRFNTTFDYAGKRMILVPNESYGEPFEYDRSGLRLATGAQLEVEGLVDGSPAHEAGIELGDLLTQLNGKAVSSHDYVAVRDALLGEGEVRLTIERAGVELEKTVRLRRLI